eukprot:TRINITY_DN22809_c0_g1_i1.p1 TRINITY_DN22809_c0_g1~~TRINITY_DN22809_c0_g1_i1.p1  ORF type:complete len:125 (-),score=51.67 TRINITY_DN22809_c0_g1_i1:71-445(-)
MRAVRRVSGCGVGVSRRRFGMSYGNVRNYNTDEKSAAAGGTAYGSKGYGKENTSGTIKREDAGTMAQSKQGGSAVHSKKAASHNAPKDAKGSQGEADFADEYSGVSDAKMIKDLKKEPGEKHNH